MYDIAPFETKRIIFLDNLRAFTIILVITLHVSMTYMMYAPPLWYVLDSNNSLLITQLVLLLDVPIMQILFFVSGYFTLPSVQRKSSKEFLKEKIIRIGIPWIFGAYILAPIITYLTFVSRKIKIDFFSYLFKKFWGLFYQQSVYWYLGVLLILFIMIIPFLKRLNEINSNNKKNSQIKWIDVLLFFILMVIPYFSISIDTLEAWENLGYIIMFIPERVPLYLGYFVLGIYAYKYRWANLKFNEFHLIVAAVLTFISGFLYVYVRFVFSIEIMIENIVSFKALNALLYNGFCLISLIFGLFFFNFFLNSKNRFWNSLANNSYGIYYLHPLIAYPLTYSFTEIDISIFLKLLIIVSLTILSCWLTSAYFLKKTPYLRMIF